MASNNPKIIIDQGTMSFRQWIIVIVMVCLNALDGFDILSISFAAPSIAADWGIDRAALGWVLSMELLGMSIGSIALGGVADKFGRRPTILGCLIVMTIGMYGAGHSTNIESLLGWRFFTGLGIGGLIVGFNAITAEVSNLKWRSFAMAIMVIGYPLGGVFGGLVVQSLLKSGTWHDIFIFGSWVSALFIPVVWFLVPESVAFLARIKNPNGIISVNKILTRFNHPSISEWEAESLEQKKRSLVDIFKPGLLLVTVLITFAYFAHITSFYFILKWVPKIVVDMGFAPVAAAGVLTWVNVGGATGGVIFGLLAIKMNLKALTVAILIGASGLIVWFGRGVSDLASLSVTVAIAGAFTNGALVGIYALFAKVFPTHVRATGTGFAIGMGRGGAIIAPIVAGYLFQAGFVLQTVAIFMGAGSLLAAVAILLLKIHEQD
jgi:benzoate transport